uniref:Uncharacterized protein n=1 Tax=Anopheles quadriannulatus TaxID=34691 RepID=A0A182XTY0_ANOQN
MSLAKVYLAMIYSDQNQLLVCTVI